jgi:hypothetical protein
LWCFAARHGTIWRSSRLSWAWWRGDKFQREFLLLFFPIHFRECRLSQIESIETGLEEQLGVAYGILLGVKTFIVGKIVDRLLPWLAGDFKIWVRLNSGRRVLAWQGNNQRDFHHNLEVLEASTLLRAVRGPDTDVYTTAEVSELLQEVTVVQWLKAFFAGKRRPPLDDARDDAGDQPPRQAK